ncbi:hypothetical protein BDV95DRAFT_572040 [Massariosphaeria phaeospora]|uniref:Uncharacterized protein n=1 Tax=Massariosphaeria phaeospora TaxID=100035 RepID=A0A7C8M9M5_9PLEO|nr:hypothetical protein BDV95DRAFT_572040 [Massariosphaeria phaeospora]
MLRAVVEEIIRAATFALHDVSSNMVDTVPVFVPHCLYKAAMVGLQAPRQPGQGDAETAVRPLVGLLRAMGSRWLAAGKYVKEIERSMDVDTTLTG